MKRFKYSESSRNNLLKSNNKFILPKRHALQHFKTGAIYSFIPKNACSTMRFSLAVENGCLSESSDVNWIHHNNGTFNTSLRELFSTPYSFVILRCPYRRLVSSFLDKIVSKKNDAWQFINSINRSINIDSLTFEDFVTKLENKNILNSNIHWRPQSDFLLYENYDEYFCLEDFQTLTKTLKNKIDFNVIDTRNQLNHDSSRLANKHYPESYKLSIHDLYLLKMNNDLPIYKSFYNNKIMNSLQNMYSEDFELYRNNCDAKFLLFADL